MDSSNITLAKSLYNANTHTHIKYPFINSVLFNPDLLLNYCQGFNEYDINIRNEFMKYLYTLHNDTTIIDEFLLSLKPKIQSLMSVYHPFSNFANYCKTMNLYMNILHSMTNKISLLLIKHSLYIYGRFLPRLINGLVSKNKIEIISIFANNKDNMRNFFLELCKTQSCTLASCGSTCLVMIKGLKFVLKFRLIEKTIEEFIKDTSVIEQMYVESRCCIKYTHAYFTASNKIINLNSYDYDDVYEMLDIYYTTTNNLIDVWHDKPTMRNVLVKILKILPTYQCNNLYREHY